MLYHLKVKRTHAFVITLIICDRNRAFRVFRLWNVCSWEYCCIQLNPGSVMSLQWIELVCLMTTADLAEMCCRAQRVVRRTLIGFYLEEEIERAGLDLEQPLRPDYPVTWSTTQGLQAVFMKCTHSDTLLFTSLTYFNRLYVLDELLFNKCNNKIIINQTLK